MGFGDLLAALRDRVEVHLVTADTHGSQAMIDSQLGSRPRAFRKTGQAGAKLEYIRRLGAHSVRPSATAPTTD